MAENFLNPGRDLVIQVHEVNRSIQNFNTKWFPPRHIIINLSKIKDKNRDLKQARVGKSLIQGKPMRLWKMNGICRVLQSPWITIGKNNFPIEFQCSRVTMFWILKFSKALITIWTASALPHGSSSAHLDIIHIVTMFPQK